MAARFNELLVAAGGLTVVPPLSLPNAVITDAMIAAAANVAASKLVTQFEITYSQKPGANVVADTVDVHHCRAATAGSTLLDGWAVITGVVPVGAYTCSVDVQRSRSGGAFASILTGVTTFAAGAVLRTAVQLSISDNTVQQHDIFRVVITIAGGAGTQPQGLFVSLAFTEFPN